MTRGRAVASFSRAAASADPLRADAARRRFGDVLPRRAWLAGVLSVGALAAGLAIEAPSAEAIQTAVAQPHLVGVVPGTNTPDVRDGVVFAIAKVGTEVFLGGSFTKVSPHGSSTTYLVNHAVAFDAATGTIDTT